MTFPAIDRRLLLHGAVATPLLAAAIPAAARAIPRRVRTPESDIDLYVRMLGNSAGGRTYVQYDTDIFCLADHTVPLLAFRIRGIARSDWSRSGPHSYHQASFDHGLICDKDNGKAIDSWRNPLTGQDNVPLHYRSGPFRRDLGPLDDKGKPFALALKEAGGGVWFTDTSAGARTNWIQPDKYPLASTGKDVWLGTSSTYMVEREFIDDPRRTALPASNFWNFISNYPAWMLMGERPGFVLWRWIARKITRFGDLDPYLVAEIERRLPGYFTLESPWRDYSNGWIQYGRERPDEVR